MRRFFVEDINEGSREVFIKGEEFAHLRKVLRVKEGERVSVFNGKGLELCGAVVEVSGSYARVRVDTRVENKLESPIGITLLQGLLKGDRTDLIVQKATELGVKEIVFYTTERTVPWLKGERKEKRLSRWRKVAIEAAKQCGRARIPGIKFLDFNEALEGCAGLRKKIVLFEGVDGTLPVKEVLGRSGGEAGRGVVAVVGPEGGFSDEEIKEARSRGFIPVGLGPSILRSETASIAVLSILQYELGDLSSPPVKAGIPETS